MKLKGVGRRDVGAQGTAYTHRGPLGAFLSQRTLWGGDREGWSPSWPSTVTPPHKPLLLTATPGGPGWPREPMGPGGP